MLNDSNAPSGSTTSRDGQECSAFQRALRQFLDNLPEKSKKGALIQACTSGGDAVTAESINEYIKRVEGRKTSRHKIEKFLSPVVNVLRAYDGVINSLVSADPMPTALIWGALKVVIDGVYRFTSLFETIRTELESLTFQLKRISEYEDLYGDSEIMQGILCRSYINMFRFWHQVDKECDRCHASFFSFRINKLQKIISDLRSNVDQIRDHGSIVESRKAEGERQRGRVEASKADQDRVEAQKTRRSFQEWHAKQQKERHDEYYRAIQSWISIQLQAWNEANNCTRHRENLKVRQDGTCDWLARHSVYSAWQNGTTNPSIFWLHSPPGFGKTLLCSYALQQVKDSNPPVSVVYHFYREEYHTGSETLRILAGQLLECYGKHSTQVDEELYLKTQRRTCSLENIQELITILIENLPKTYFFIDGLDQETSPERWTEASTVLDFLVRLSMRSPHNVRIWCSSQSHPDIREKLKDAIMFDVKDHLGVRADVTLYLSRVMSHDYPELDQDVEEKDRLLEHLQKRVDGNFLCASLMIEALREETDSLTELQEFIKQGDLPKTLHGYYHRKFEKITSPRRRLARNIFALVAFAGRPLRLKELREALGLLQSKTPHFPKAGDMPFTKRLQELFAPMIEVQSGGSDADMDGDSYCRLFHSTVRDFLMKNPNVLGQNLPITERIIADACLGYLSQSRYAELLIASGTDWFDVRRENVDQHHFLLYAAKYWNKHLGHVPGSAELHRRVLSFVTSSNFQTCIQVQSLWIEHKFAVFNRRGDEANQTYLLRVFPKWFTSHIEEQSTASRHGAKVWKDYRRFVHDWRHLLSCEKGGAGEIDRCWWAALGSQNFLSKCQGRYVSFMFQADEDTHYGSWRDFDGVSMSGDQLKKLRLNSRNEDMLEFVCEHWSLSAGDSAPALEKRQTILAHVKATNWLLYGKYSGDKSTERVGGPAPAMFSPDCQFLRIGAQFFVLDDQGTYIAMPGLHVESEGFPAYVEEFAFCKPYAVFATRRKVTEDTYQRETGGRRNDDFGEKIMANSDSVMAVTEGRDDEESTADSESDSSYVSTMDSTDRAYETWSECSTQYDDDFEDDVIAPWTRAADIEEDSSESSQYSALETEENTPDADQSERSGPDSASELDAELPTSAIVGYGQPHSDDEDYGLDGEGTYHAQIFFPRRPWVRKPRDLQVSLTVFNTGCSESSRVFYFSCTVSSMIYDSPPVVHPSQSLVVWPLGGGEVLFADFVANTYFLRKLRPSTSYTRHVFMKCCFSPCGQYLHMASLEVQCKPLSISRRNEERDPLKIALLVSTYRLCGRKTTKSPPTLIHRVKVHIGYEKSLSVSELLYTLTWTPNELYFTCSAEVLRLYRIPLFNNPDRLDKSEHVVLMPKGTIFLPGTASQRKVYYFPPAVGSTRARIIVGSEIGAHDVKMDGKLLGGQQDNIPSGVSTQVHELGGNLSPPIGCYLDETEDLGGWGNSKDRLSIPDALGIGKLDRRREKFDFDDDCDLEEYIF